MRDVLGVGLALAGLLAGCGRLGFDGAVDGGALVSDALDAAAACTFISHDEDGDARDDGCDVCPHLVDDGTDTDGDGVGDGCDPAPAVPGNRILAFLPFTDGTVPSGWDAVAQNTTWTFGADEARIALSFGDVAVITGDPARGADVVIEARVTVDVVNPVGGSPGRNAALVDGHAGTPGLDDTLLLGIHQDANEGLPALVTGFLLSAGNVAESLPTVNVGGFITPGTTYALRYNRAGTLRTITVTPGGTMMVDRAEPAGRVGVRLRGVTARVHSLIIIE